jgi:hypothetical protein
MLVEIQNDVYFINSRLKEIDENYQIFFNTRKRSFEVHNKGQIGSSYCLTAPYSSLDARLIDFVRKTRVENRRKLIEEIDKNNEKLDKLKEKRILENAKDRLFDLIKYSN